MKNKGFTVLEILIVFTIGFVVILMITAGVTMNYSGKVKYRGPEGIVETCVDGISYLSNKFDGPLTVKVGPDGKPARCD